MAEKIAKNRKSLRNAIIVNIKTGDGSQVILYPGVGANKARADKWSKVLDWVNSNKENLETVGQVTIRRKDIGNISEFLQTVELMGAGSNMVEAMPTPSLALMNAIEKNDQKKVKNLLEKKGAGTPFFVFE